MPYLYHTNIYNMALGDVYSLNAILLTNHWNVDS